MESIADERLCQPVTEDPIAVATALAATRPVEQEIEEIETEQMETEQTGAAPPRMSVADATQTELAAGAPHEVSAEVLAWQVDVGARLTKLASTAVDAALAPVRAGALHLEATWPCAKCASTHNRLWRSCAICGEPMPLSEVIVSTLPLYPPTSLHLLHHPRPPRILLLLLLLLLLFLLSTTLPTPSPPSLQVQKVASVTAHVLAQCHSDAMQLAEAHPPEQAAKHAAYKLGAMGGYCYARQEAAPGGVAHPEAFGQTAIKSLPPAPEKKVYAERTPGFLAAVGSVQHQSSPREAPPPRPPARSIPPPPPPLRPPVYRSMQPPPPPPPPPPAWNDGYRGQRRPAKRGWDDEAEGGRSTKPRSMGARDEDGESQPSKATSDYTLHETKHSKERCEQREIVRRHVQLAIKHGNHKRTGRDRWQVRHAGLVQPSDPNPEPTLSLALILSLALTLSLTLTPSLALTLSLPNPEPDPNPEPAGSGPGPISPSLSQVRHDGLVAVVDDTQKWLVTAYRERPSMTSTHLLPESEFMGLPSGLVADREKTLEYWVGGGLDLTRDARSAPPPTPRSPLSTPSRSQSRDRSLGRSASASRDDRHSYSRQIDLQVSHSRSRSYSGSRSSRERSVGPRPAGREEEAGGRTEAVAEGAAGGTKLAAISEHGREWSRSDKDDYLEQIKGRVHEEVTRQRGATEAGALWACASCNVTVLAWSRCGRCGRSMPRAAIDAASASARDALATPHDRRESHAANAYKMGVMAGYVCGRMHARSGGLAEHPAAFAVCDEMPAPPPAASCSVQEQQRLL